MSRPLRPTSSSPSDCSGGDFDWDVALRKLDELNARVEDPTLWDKPDEAQAVSRGLFHFLAQTKNSSSGRSLTPACSGLATLAADARR